MSVDLSRFRADAEPQPPSEPDVLLCHWTGSMLSWDQTIAKTAWTHIICRDGEAPMVVATGMCPTDKTDIKGWGDYLDRAEGLFEQIQAVIDIIKPDLIVHEAPPMGSGLSKPESSLVAGTAVRLAAKATGIPVCMIHAQHAKKRLTGNGNADKKLVRAAILERWPSVNDLRPKNEDTFDAIAVGVIAAERGSPHGR